MGGLAFRRIRPLLDEDDVSGFSSGNGDNDAWLKERAHRAMRDGTARVYVLPQLAVDERCQGKSAGARLLQDAIRRAAAASRLVASRALVVDPADEHAEGFYAHFGFQRLASDSRRMFVRL